MPATNSTTHKFFEAKPRLAGKVGAGGVPSTSSTTIPHNFVDLTEGNAYIVTVNRTDATGTTKNPASETESFIGVVSGTNFINCVREVEGVAQAWPADTVLEILVTAYSFNELIDGIEAEHNQDGTHKSGLVLTLPQINDTSSNHQYIVAVNELAADRTVTLPLLTGNDEFVFKDHAQTLANKTLTSPVLNTGVSGTAVLDEDNMASDSATKLATQQSIKAYADTKIAKPGSSAQGDILYRNGSDWTRLAAGISGQVLKTQGAGANPTWGNIVANPSWSAALSSDQSVTQNSDTKLALATEEFDIGSNFDASTNYRFTVPSGKAGIYLITMAAEIQSPADNTVLMLKIFKNGSVIKDGQFHMSNAGYGEGCLTALLNLAESDYIEYYVRHNNSGSKSMTALNRTWGAGHFIGATS